jgi:imidazoleglycerol-phosphate dehydratase
MSITGNDRAAKAGTGARRAALRRKSRETEVLVALALDPESPAAEIDSGIGFLDHMLTSLATHAGWDLRLACRGDLAVDDHHSVEDCAIALGETLARALAAGAAAGRPPKRFGSAYAPLDEALARAVIDLSGRPFCRTELGLSGASLGGLEGENVGHFFWSLASTAKMTLHIDVLAGDNAHHKAEAAFKALALALREAAASSPLAPPDSGTSGPASTKGSVSLETIDEGDWARLKGALDA